MIAAPGEPDLPVLVLESFHEQTDEELTETDIKRIEADDQAIQTILLGLPEDIYVAVDSCETAKEIWERVRQMMKGSDIGEQEKKAKLFNEWEKFTSTEGESIESYYHRFMQLMNDLKRNKHFPENIASNLKFLNNLQPEWKRHVTIVRQTKNLHETDFTQIYDFLKMNQEENAGVQGGGNHNGLVVVLGIANQSGTGNVVAARAEGTRNGNQVRIQHQAEEFDFMAAAGDLDEIEEVNANCILMENLQQASTTGTQHDRAPVYDTYRSAEVHLNDNCYDNEIFNMFTQEEQYTDLLEPIPEPQLVSQNDNHVISVAPIDQVAQVERINRNMRATNAELKSELASYKIQEQRVEISQEKYDKLEKCYQKSVYQEQCLTRKINALHLSSAKQITTLNDEISNLNKQLSKEKSFISSLIEEKKKLKHDFKIQEDKFLDKEVDLKARIKDPENILLKRDQTVQTMHMLNSKPDSFYHPNKKMALGYPNPSYLKKAQLKQQSLYNGNLVLKEHDPPVVVFVPQMTKSKEELFLSNISNMVIASKTISIPNEDLSDDTTPSVARKFLNEEADESLDKQKSLELKIERLLKVSVSHDIMSIMQNGFVNVPSDLQTELDRTKEKLELCIIKKEKEYDILWNNWCTKCEECKYDKISYDNAYNDMQQKVKRLKAQLRDLKGKHSDTPSASNTLDPLNQKLESKIIELEFHVVNYEREISHLKDTYKNLFDSIKSNRAHAKLHDLIYENAQLRARGFENTSKSAKNTSGMSVTPHVDKPKLSAITPHSKKFHASTQSHSLPQPREFNVMKHRNVIAHGMFKIKPSQT
nr:hypothetical protein [Tanacetum cinerariifolium]